MSETQFDLILLSPDKEEQKVFTEIAKDFSYSFKILNTLDELLESGVTPLLLVVSGKAAVDGVQTTELMQVATQTCPNAYLILLVPKQLPKKESEFLQKLGARLILMDYEVPFSKTAFSVNQVLRADYLPLKPADLVPDKAIPFTMYHLMPQRNKFLPIIRAGDVLDAARRERFQHNSEYYFARADSVIYKKYVEENADKSAKGLAKRCRANLVALQEEFNRLVFELTDESDKASFADGQELLKRCIKLCEDLLLNLAEFPKAWEIVNNSSIGSFGSLERAPAIAAYCGLFGLQSEFDKIPELMLIALLLDIGVLALPNSFTRMLRGDAALNAADEAQFRGVPKLSLDLILKRKLAIDERTRSIMLTVYNSSEHEKELKIEAQLIRFAKQLDSKTQLKMGKVVANPLLVIEEMIRDAVNDKSYTKEFLTLLSTKILPEIQALKNS